MLRRARAERGVARRRRGARHRPDRTGLCRHPPTFGALYRDGPGDRWLLGGTWLYRADTADAGVAAGWWRNVASTDGWSPVTVPNSFNAGDLSQASHERLGGLVPARLHDPGQGLCRLCAGAVPQLDRALRVGQLPGHRVAQRPQDRLPRGGIPPVRVRAHRRASAGSIVSSSAWTTGATAAISRRATAAGGTTAASTRRSISARSRRGHVAGGDPPDPPLPDLRRARSRSR